jgi:hypothetical protein
MADTLDYRLTHPSSEQLCATLQTVCEAAGWNRPTPDWSRSTWETIQERCEREPEGHLQWEEPGPPTTYLTLSWWTDLIGLRHYRIGAGDSTRLPVHRAWTRAPEEDRPPLWHVYPDRIFRRQHNGTDAWLAVCTCGVAGPPASLGWRGERCGPCQDRREEGQEAPVENRADTLAFDPLPIEALAVSRDGRWLAVAQRGGRVHLHDLHTRERRLLRDGTSPPSYIRAMAFTWNAEQLVIAPPEDTLQGLDCATGKVLREYAWAFSPTSIVWAPRDQGWGASTDNGVLLGNSSNGRYSCMRVVRATAVCFLPSGCTALVGWDREIKWFVLEEERWESHDRLERPTRYAGTALADGETILHLEVDDAGRFLLVIAGEPDDAIRLERPSRRETCTAEVWDLAEAAPRLRFRSLVPHPTAAAFSSDGRFLALLIHDQQHSPAAIQVLEWGRSEGRGAWSVLEWDSQEMLGDLCFLPDGSTLLTGGAGGTVKCWPWRHLVEE